MLGVAVVVGGDVVDLEGLEADWGDHEGHFDCWRGERRWKFGGLEVVWKLDWIGDWIGERMDGERLEKIMRRYALVMRFICKASRKILEIAPKTRITL